MARCGELMIDRIYDTLIDEEELRICDDTRPRSSRIRWSLGLTVRGSLSREMGCLSGKDGENAGEDRGGWGRVGGV